MALSVLSLTSSDAFNQGNVDKDEEKIELKVEGSFSSRNYLVGEEFDVGNIKVSYNNEEITDYVIQLDDSITIYDGYVFESTGSYEVSIAALNQHKYTFEEKLLVSMNELHADSSKMKTIYLVGESFSSSGLVVYDKNNKNVTDYKLDYKEGHVFTRVMNTTLVITKDGYMSTSIPIRVNEPSALVLDVENVKTIYKVGETFSLEGLKVYDSYENEITDFTSSIEEGIILNNEGEFEVTISKGSYEDASFTIYVTSLNIMEVVEDENFKDEYAINETFDPSVYKVIDTSTNQVLSDYNFYLNSNLINENYYFEDLGTKKITIKKEGYLDIIFEINVVSARLLIQNMPSKVEYIVGESFSSSGLVVSDGARVISDYTLSIKDGTTFKYNDIKEVIVSKEGYRNATFEIKVNNEKGLFIKSKPTKSYYEVGDKFDPTGLIVVDNNTYQEITNYSLSISTNETLNDVGKHTVFVNVDNYPQASFEIEVINKINVGESRNIKLYCINDTHGAFTRNSEDKEAGMAYIGQYMLNKKNENSLILSMGDMWQGGIESNDTKGRIMVEAMNIASFDAMAIGNHEFDWGEEYLLKNQDYAAFPFLSSNIFYAGTNNLVDFATPSMIIDKGGIQIGIIGSARENMGSSIITSVAKNYDFPTPNSYIKEESNKLREAGCDIVILASHDEGMDGYDGEPTQFNDITQISSTSNQRYVDTMLFAHDHYRKNGQYNGVTYLESGCNGEYIGEVTINVTKTGENEYVVNDSSSSSRYFNAYSACTTANSEIANLVDKFDDVIRDASKVIYTFNNSYTSREFAVIVCQAMLWFMEKYNNVFDNKSIYLTSHNYGGIRSDVNKGEFTYSDLVAVCPFSNCLSLVKCTYSQMSYMSRSSALASYENPNGRVESDGYYYCGTISYVAEWTNSNKQSSWTSYTHYDEYIIGDVLYEYLVSNPSLGL